MNRTSPYLEVLGSGRYLLFIESFNMQTEELHLIKFKFKFKIQKIQEPFYYEPMNKHNTIMQQCFWNFIILILIKFKMKNKSIQFQFPLSEGDGEGNTLESLNPISLPLTQADPSV